MLRIRSLLDSPAAELEFTQQRAPTERRLSRFRSIAVVLAWSASYVAATLFLSSAWYLRHARATGAEQSHADFLVTVQIPTWWWAVLVGPPAVLVAWWLVRYGRRGA